MHKILIFYFLSLLPFALCAQKNDSTLYRFKKATQELKELQTPVFYSRRESDRLEANKEFISVWKTIVDDPRVLDLTFDSLKDVSVVTPPDKKFKLITWDFHKEDGTYAYFGFLLVNNSRRVRKGFMRHATELAYEAYQLSDRSYSVKSPETYAGGPDKWFGMIYTQVIECDGFYTLIGWDGNNNLTQRKFVDVLYFKSDGSPVFGKDVFHFPRKNPKRLMFEWSSKVSMSLRYYASKNQIVYSHLAPSEEGAVMEGQLQYYGPDGSFDAIELKKDKWVTVEDVDARYEKNQPHVNDISDKDRPNSKKHHKIMPGYKPK